MAIRPLIAISTGMTSERYCPSHSIERITPLAPPTIKPIGPFKLSTHPGSGSSQAGDTEMKKKIPLWDIKDYIKQEMCYSKLGFSLQQGNAYLNS